MSRGRGQRLVLEPNLHSYDPDRPFSVPDPNITYRYFAKRESEAGKTG